MPLILILSAALSGPVQPPGQGGQPADLIVRAARIYTVDPARPTARMLAVRDGKILAVGDDLAAYAGPRTRRIEVPDAIVVPGFIDSHAHMEALGELLETFDFRHARTPEEIIEAIRKEAARRPRGEWIQGRNWDQTNWGGRFPDAAELSRAVPDHPVYLTRVDGHAAWVNRKALELAGITAATPDPPGGKILRDASGQPTGILIDRAQSLVAAKIPPPGPEVLRRRLARAARECARLGLTTVHDAGVSADVLAAYRDLIARDELPIRIYAMIGGEGKLWREYLERGPEIGERLTVRSIKLMADGAMGSRGAAFFEPYNDDPGNTGLLHAPARRYRTGGAPGRRARLPGEHPRHRRPRQPHRAGSLRRGAGRAQRPPLSHRARAGGGARGLREIRPLFDHRLDATHPRHQRHAMGRGAHRSRARKRCLRLASLPRPRRSHRQRLGLPRRGSQPPVGLLCRHHAPGSPWPAARRVVPEQRMTRQEALESWTIRGAYAAFEEKVKGSLTPGKMADFVILSRDIMSVPPAEILKTRVLMTVVAGRIVHSELP
jgi:predicted amidohydrolase YtcJ